MCVTPLIRIEGGLNNPVMHVMFFQHVVIGGIDNVKLNDDQ